MKPRVATDGELARILAYTRYFIEPTGGAIPITAGGHAGPPRFGGAHARARHVPRLALYTHPADMHRLLGMVTDLTIRFAKAQRELCRALGGEFVPSMFQPWMPDGIGVSISNDECALVSAAMHDEFSVPYINRISEAFGGVYIHSCGAWAHQIPSLKKVKNLRGLEFGASEAPFEPVLEEFAGRPSLRPGSGITGR